MALESSSGDAPGSRATVMAKAHHQRHAGTPHRFRHYYDDDPSVSWLHDHEHWHEKMSDWHEQSIFAQTRFNRKPTVVVSNPGPASPPRGKSGTQQKDELPEEGAPRARDVSTVHVVRMFESGRLDRLKRARANMIRERRDAWYESLVDTPEGTCFWAWRFYAQRTRRWRKHHRFLEARHETMMPARNSVPPAPRNSAPPAPGHARQPQRRNESRRAEGRHSTREEGRLSRRTPTVSSTFEEVSGAIRVHALGGVMIQSDWKEQSALPVGKLKHLEVVQISRVLDLTNSHGAHRRYYYLADESGWLRDDRVASAPPAIQEVTITALRARERWGKIRDLVLSYQVRTSQIARLAIS